MTARNVRNAEVRDDGRHWRRHAAAQRTHSNVTQQFERRFAVDHGVARYGHNRVTQIKRPTLDRHTINETP